MWGCTCAHARSARWRRRRDVRQTTTEAVPARVTYRGISSQERATGKSYLPQKLNIIPKQLIAADIQLAAFGSLTRCEGVKGMVTALIVRL